MQGFHFSNAPVDVVLERDGGLCGLLEFGGGRLDDEGHGLVATSRVVAPSSLVGKFARVAPRTSSVGWNASLRLPVYGNAEPPKDSPGQDTRIRSSLASILEKAILKGRLDQRWWQQQQQQRSVTNL